MVWHGISHDIAWHCTAWHSTLRHGMAQHGMARQGAAWHGMARHGMASLCKSPHPKPAGLGEPCHPGYPQPSSPHAMGAVSAGPPGRAYYNLPALLPWGQGFSGGTRSCSGSEPPKQSPHASRTRGSPGCHAPGPPAQRCPAAGHPRHGLQARRCPPLPNRCCPLFLAGAGAVRGALWVPSPIANTSRPTAAPPLPAAGRAQADNFGTPCPRKHHRRRVGAVSAPG